MSIILFHRGLPHLVYMHDYKLLGEKKSHFLVSLTITQSDSLTTCISMMLLIG